MIGGERLALFDGQSIRLPFREGRCVGLSIPFVEEQARTSARHAGIRFNGGAPGRTGRWIPTGELTYRSRNEVDPLLGTEGWWLFGNALRSALLLFLQTLKRHVHRCNSPVDLEKHHASQ